jgi:hypothetical protein
VNTRLMTFKPITALCFENGHNILNFSLSKRWLERNADA